MDWEEWEERYGIDPDELGEMVESLIAQEGATPTFRATIRGGRLWLSAWSPQMARPSDGPERRLAPDVAVAELTVAEVEGESGRRDLIARFLCQQRGRRRGRDADRLGLADRILEALAPRPPDRPGDRSQPAG